MVRFCTRRLPALLLILCLLVSLLPLTVYAAPALPAANTETRHVVCTALSDRAAAYYTGSYTYQNLSALEGASSNYDSYAVTQNNPLYTALQTLMSSTQTYTPAYGGSDAGSLAYYWTVTDAIRGLDTYVMFYSDVDPSGYTMNREHVWPKSRASYYQKNGGADLHHLRPSVKGLNTAKSNHMFGNIVGKYASYNSGTVGNQVCYWTYGAGDLFECKDDVKGDVARILLYVYVRWGQPNLYTEVSSAYLPAMDADDSQNTGAPVVESLETLLDWCENDPVDTWEMTRNDLIQEIQGNRNVFIDYPELAWLLFGEEIPAGMQTPTSGAQPCAHNWAETQRAEPTCTAAGSVTYTCTRCGETYAETLEPLGHAYAAAVTEPTCTAAGFTVYTCARCGDSYTAAPTEALGHLWDEGVLTVPASEEAPGLMTYTCLRCGETRAEEVPWEAQTFRFEDVQDPEAYFFAPVYWAHDSGVTQGTSAKVFSPEAPVTRAQMVTFLYRAAGSPAVSGHTDFTDVEAGSYYEAAVLWAVAQGVTDGTSATAFSPAEPCSRAQMVTFLYRAAGSPAVSGTVPFADVGEDAYYAAAVRWALAQGITKGTSATAFSPARACTRGEAVTFLYRAR